MRSDNKRDGQLDSIVRAIVSAARLEFKEVAEITDAGDRIDAIAAGINMLVEELKESVVSKDRLQKSEEKYRSLYEGTIVGKFRVNISTQRPVAANGKVAQMFGYGSVAELMDEFKVGDHYRNPEERDLMLHLVSMYGEVHDYELEFVRKDGTTFWGSCSGKLYAEEGHVEGSIVDISARKRVEDQLKKEKLLEEEHFQSARNIMVVLRPDGTVERINKAGAAILESHPEDIEGLNWFDNFLSEDIRPTLYPIFNSLLNGDPFAHEFVVNDIRSVKGNTRTIEWHNGMYTNADGEVRMISSGEDITQQQLLVNQLQEAQRIARIGHWTLDLLSMQLDWSDEMFRILELEQGSVLTYDSFLALVHPEDKEFLDSSYWSSVKNGSTYDIKHRLLLPNGCIKWLREKCETFYNKEGVPIRSMGTTQDITDTYNLELELGLASTAINNTLSSIFIADREGKISYANPASAKCWGYEDVTQMLKERPHVMDYWTDDTIEQAEAIVVELMVSGIFRGEGLVGKRKDGTTFPVELNACVMKNSEGVPISMIGSFSDITLSKEASSKILQALIEGQENERKRISMDIHDQLGQDLIGIKFRLHHLDELILAASMPTEQKEAIEDQMRISLTGLKQAIQFTSSLGVQLYPPIFQDSSIEEALEELVGKYRSSCHHIRFILTVETPMPETDDRMRLSIYRIVQEALTNVVRHSKATTAIVVLSATSDSVNLTISDNGIGYPDHYRNTVGFGLKGISQRVLALSGSVRFIGLSGATIEVILPTEQP